MRLKRRLIKRCLLLLCIFTVYYVCKVTVSTLSTHSQYGTIRAEKYEKRENRGFLKKLTSKLQIATTNLIEIFKVRDKLCNTSDVLLDDLPSEKDTWLPVDKEGTAYVFSAYYVLSKNKIVIIGTKTAASSTVVCTLWYRGADNSYSSVEVKTGQTKLPEGREMRYSTYLFTCDLKGREIPDFISVVSTDCYRPYHVMYLRSVITSEEPKRMFTVCLSPLNKNYSNQYQLIEWIEMNRIYGAKKFVIYNHSSNSEVGKVLDFYSKRGIAEVVQWNLPIKTQTVTSQGFQKANIHYYGQEAAINDCLYREKQYSEFVVNIDLDEFIVPRSEKLNTWSDIIKHMKNESGAFIVRNTFFRTDWTNDDVTIDNKEISEKFKLVTMQTITREAKIFPPGHRAKCFVRTSIAEVVMIHYVPALPRANIPTHIPEKIALLHHYRSWDGEDPASVGRKVDKTMPDKYGKILIHNVKKIWSDLTL
ncbi:hypothetical protein ACF0H5_015445 [Mactra antiquata]